MAYKYDPILCMMVEDKSTNTRDVALPVMQDAIQFVQLRFSSGRTEGAKLDESEYREYAESLLKLYGEKQVTISKNGKVIVTYINRRSNDSLSKATRMCKLKDAETTRDGMFSKTFSKYTNDARWKVQQGLSELSKVNDKKQVDPVSQAYVKELNKIAMLQGRGTIIEKKNGVYILHTSSGDKKLVIYPALFNPRLLNDCLAISDRRCKYDMESVWEELVVKL